MMLGGHVTVPQDMMNNSIVPRKHMKMQRSFNHVRATKNLFTVCIQCCDPPIPAHYVNTNYEAGAKKLFESLKQTEIDEGGGGEFTIMFWKHGWKPTIKYMRVEADESEYGHEFVYYIDYPDSEVLGEFSYMDLVLEK